MRLFHLVVKATTFSGVLLLIAGASLAGDIKGKVSVQGIKSAEKYCGLRRHNTGQEVRDSDDEAGDGSDKNDVFASRHGCASRNHGGVSEQRSGGPQRVLAQYQRQQEVGSQPRYLAEGRKEELSVQ